LVFSSGLKERKIWLSDKQVEYAKAITDKSSQTDAIAELIAMTRQSKEDSRKYRAMKLENEELKDELDKTLAQFSAKAKRNP